MGVICVAWWYSGYGVGLAAERSRVRSLALRFHVTTLGKLFIHMCLCQQAAWLPWGRNFYPHTYPIPIPMGIPIPTAESRAAVVMEFLSPYPPHTHTNGDPHTHGRPAKQ